MPQAVSADACVKSAASKRKADAALTSTRLKSASEFRTCIASDFCFGTVFDFCSALCVSFRFALFGFSVVRSIVCSVCTSSDFSAADNRCAGERAAKTAAINIQR